MKRLRVVTKYRECHDNFRCLCRFQSSSNKTSTIPNEPTVKRILPSRDTRENIPLVDFLAQEPKRDYLSELFFPDHNSRKFSTLQDIPVMLPYRWCIELQRVIRETFKEMEFRNKSLLYRAFLHPTFCGLNQQYTADGLLEVGKSVLRYIYTTCLLHSFPDFLTDGSVSIEKVVEDLSKPSVVAETCLAEWRNLGSMVLTDVGISKLRNVFSPKCWSLKELDNSPNSQPQFHYLTRDSDPAKFHPELAGLPTDETDADDHNVTPGREKYYNVPFEETLGYSFIGALYYDKGLPSTMAFVKMYMLKYAIGCLVEETE